MKIIKIDTFPLFYPLKTPYGDANGFKNYRSCYLLRIHTQSGYSGWGEVIDWLPTLDRGFHERIIPFLLGKDATDRTSLVETISKWHQRSATGVSMALTEILAQATNLSICDLWGGALHQQIPVYASFQSYRESTDWINESYKQVKAAIHQGFTSCKVKIGGKKLSEDASHIQTLLAKLDCNVGIILDANQSYDLSTAKWWERIFADFGCFLWFEEPMPLDNPIAYKTLRNFLSVAVAGGENLQSSKAFLPFLSENAMDIIQPDVNHHTGVDGYRHTLALARTFGVRVSTHTYDGALSRLYSAFAHACLPEWSKMNGEAIEPIEWDMMENPFNELLSTTLEKGHLTIPTGKGIGLEMNEELIERYRWDGRIY